MQHLDAQGTIDREMTALFAAAAETPPEPDQQFVAGVIRRIRRRQRMRWVVLGGSALIAAAVVLPAFWELLAAWNDASLNLAGALGSRLDQAAAAIADLLGAAVRSITFLTAAALAVAIAPLLRWLAD